MKDGIVILSLFDGIAGAYQAMKNININVQIYYASEIDKYAVQISKKNHKDIIQLGDIKDWKNWQINYKNVDLVIFGSPCQDLSIAKKGREGLSGEKSGLFWYAVNILSKTNAYFLMENVASMKKSDQNIISDVLGVQPILINSSLLTAQQRKRLYWTNIPNIEQPKDRHIYLQDILESGNVDKLKVYCIDANYWKGTNLEQYIKKSKRQLVLEKPNFVTGFESGRKKWLNNKKELSRNYSQGNRIYDTNGKSVSLNANGGGMGAKTGLYAVALTETRTKEAKQIRKYYMTKYKRDYSPRRGKELKPRIDGKSNCLTTNQTKESLIYHDFMVRKLTPTECERLQGFPDGYTSGISNTQRYKSLGNSFTVPVISHILSHLPKEYFE